MALNLKSLKCREYVLAGEEIFGGKGKTFEISQVTPLRTETLVLYAPLGLKRLQHPICPVRDSEIFHFENEAPGENSAQFLIFAVWEKVFEQE